MIEYNNIYFIGIGGVGMSAIARMLRSRGAVVSGSDASESLVTEGLQEEGIKVNLTQVAENLENRIECVVYTTAIPEDNPELVEAKKRGLPIYTYAQMLGILSKDLDTIAISGAHGKTTTTAMTSAAFHGAGKKPHVIIGSLLPSIKSNYIKGTEDLLITEACEYNRTFLNLSPKHLVITNIDEDHLDYFKDLDDIKSAFVEMAEKVHKDGKIICDPTSPNLAQVVEKFADKIIDYTKFMSEVPKLKVIGKHNIANAAAALAAVSIYKGKDDLEGAKKGLEEFSGTWRRLEVRGTNGSDAVIYDDYAHHPDEIHATISSLKGEFPNKKIVVFFQPHLYSRTKLLLDGFVKALSEADEIYLLPIYAAREKEDSSISSEILTDKLKEVSQDGKVVEYLDSFEEAAKKINEKDSENIVVTMGAGDVYKILDLI